MMPTFLLSLRSMRICFITPLLSTSFSLILQILGAQMRKERWKISGSNFKISCSIIKVSRLPGDQDLLFVEPWSTGLLDCWCQFFLKNLVKNFWVLEFKALSVCSDEHLQILFFCHKMYCKIGMSLPGVSELLQGLSEEGEQVSRVLIYT